METGVRIGRFGTLVVGSCFWKPDIRGGIRYRALRDKAVIPGPGYHKLAANLGSVLNST
jgi:hypothetical protein